MCPLIVPLGQFDRSLQSYINLNVSTAKFGNKYIQYMMSSSNTLKKVINPELLTNKRIAL